MKINLLKPCDILLYKGKGLTSWLIQWGTRSPYSHVAVVVDPSILLGIESNTGHQAGVRALDLRHIGENEVDVFRVKPEFSYRKERIVSFLVARLGAKFDFWGVSWLGILKGIAVLTGFRFRPYNRFQREKDYFCSELCYAAFLAGGLDIVPEVDEAEITSPGDIAASKRLDKVVPGGEEVFCEEAQKPAIMV